MRSSENCSDVHAILDTGFLNVSLAAGVILAPVAIGLNIFLLFALRRSRGLHLNVRIQLGNISLSSVIYCVIFILRACVIWLAHWLGYACHLRLNVRQCILAEIPFTVCGGSFVWALLVVGIERAMATRLHASYEEKPSRVAWMMAAGCWLNGPMVTGVWLAFAPSDPSTNLPLCNVIFAAGDAIVVPAVLILEGFMCIGILVEYLILIKVLL